MSISTSQLKPEVVERRPMRLTRAGVLLVGVIIVPLALGLLLNSYGPLTSDSAIRMAFATVAGQSVAIGSALAVVVITLFRRRGLGEVALFVIIGVVITLGALNAMAEAGDMLLTRLDLVAQTNLLN